MSWSVSTSAPQDKIAVAIEALKVDWSTYTDKSAVREMQDQLETAKIAAGMLVMSGDLGDSGVFNVNLSGHANAGHKPRDGWAYDAMTISISRSPA